MPSCLPCSFCWILSELAFFVRVPSALDPGVPVVVAAAVVGPWRESFGVDMEGIDERCGVCRVLIVVSLL